MKMSNDQSIEMCEIHGVLGDAFVDACSGNVILSSSIVTGDIPPAQEQLLSALEGLQAECNDSGISEEAPLQWQSDGLGHMSLVIGEGATATRLRDNILKATCDHQVTMATVLKALDYCNTQTFQMVWILLSIPVDSETLHLTTSIRYASGSNRSTTVIGVAETRTSVDLRGHGIDEIAVHPVTRTDIRCIYGNWTSVHLSQEDQDTDDEGSVLTSTSEPATPATPAAPSTPATPSTPMSDETDISTFSVSMDSGIESPPAAQIAPVEIPNIAHLRNITPVARPIRNIKGVDHTTKEKLRRERIKDSCDQLRVLLPYIRGRKTDMASILEMCVDYLQIVNAAMPQSLQDQIVELLSKEPVPQTKDSPGRSGSRKTKRDNRDFSSPNNMMERNGDKTSCASAASLLGQAASQAVSSSSTLAVQGLQGPGARREFNPGLDHKPSKRLRLQYANDGHFPDSTDALVHQTAIPSVQLAQTSFDGRIETAAQGDSFPPLANYSFHSSQMSQCHGKVYTDMESSYNRMHNIHSTNDHFQQNAFFNNFTNKTNVLERDPYNYVESPLYHYYGNVHSAGGSHMIPTPDYVNPNSVLSVSCTNGRLKAEIQKLEEETALTPPSSADRESVSNQDDVEDDSSNAG